MKKITRRRKLKYNLLRNIPGKIGRRYKRQFFGSLAQKKFDEAVNQSEGLTCIDLGANIGVYTRKLALQAKQVIAFEPDPWAYSQLLLNIADLDNVLVEDAAAGTSDGTVLLYRRREFADDPASNSQSSSVIFEKKGVTLENAVEVRQIDFIRYIEERGDHIGILKMDIEGAEVELLETLFDRPDILKKIDYIFAETHESRIPSHESRVRTLRKRAMAIQECTVNLYWL